MDLSRVLQSIGTLAGKKKRSVNSTDIAEWHQKMFAQQVPLPYFAGQFRQIHTLKPCLNCPADLVRMTSFGPLIVASGYDARDVLLAMRELNVAISRVFELRGSWAADEAALLDLCTFLAEAVGQFIRIHPFLNGNGRTSRLIWIWGLALFAHPEQVPVQPRPQPPDKYEEVMAATMDGNFVPLATYIFTKLVPATLPAATGSPSSNTSPPTQNGQKP